MNHLKKRLFCCVLALLAAAAFGQEVKNALLIANGDYAKEIGALANPQSEGLGLKAALESIGFTVRFVENADLKTMQKELKAFKKKNEDTKSTAFFHYGGHAVQVKGINYLIPIGAEIEDEDDVQYNCLNVDQVMDSMSGDANIIILDSCRNNPFGQGKTRGGSGTRGLAATASGGLKAKNYMVVYSAAAGQAAIDGIFTPILTKKITERNKDISQILTEVRGEVYKATDGKQKPGDYNELFSSVYLAGRDSSVSLSKGFVQIKSDVAGVVSIDGEKKGNIKAKGTLQLELQDGTYKIEIQSEFALVQKKITVASAATSIVSIETGGILVTSEASGVIYVNNKKYREIHEKVPLRIANLPTGAKYTVEVRTESETFKQEVILMEGQDDASIFIGKSQENMPSGVASKKTQKPAKQHQSSAAASHRYSFGVYAGYSPSHFKAGPFSFTGHGVSFGILPLQMTFGIFDLKAMIGYAFTYISLNNEKLIYHELDAIVVKAGLKFAGFSFHIGLGVPVIWEVVKRQATKAGTLTRFAVSTPIDMQYAFNNYISLYAEYGPAFPVGNRGIPLVKHSFNIGVAANIFHLY